MVFLARFILKGPSQAALVAAATAMLGILFAPAVWVSAAAIALVTLVTDQRKGAMVLAYATLGAGVFSMLVFSSPLIAVYFILMAWLPAWLAAMVLKQNGITSFQFAVTGGFEFAGDCDALPGFS